MNETHLTGLEGSNPLGFLAALGVQVAFLSTSHQPRLWWSDDITPHAIVDFPIDQVVSQALETFIQWRCSPALNPKCADGTFMARGDELKLTPSDLRTYLGQTRRAGPSGAFSTALVSEGCIVQQGSPKISKKDVARLALLAIKKNFGEREFGEIISLVDQGCPDEEARKRLISKMTRGGVRRIDADRLVTLIVSGKLDQSGAVQLVQLSGNKRIQNGPAGNICSKISEGQSIFKKNMSKSERERLDSIEADIISSIVSDQGFGSEDAKEICSLAIRGKLAQRDVAKLSDFYFTAGRQLFLKMAREILGRAEREDVLRGLHGPWEYNSRIPSLMWDVSDDRAHAHSAVAPGDNEKPTNPGPEALAILGLSRYPVFSSGKRLLTQGCSRRGRNHYFSWPLWRKPAPANAVKSLLAHAYVSDRPLNTLIRHRWLHSWGITDILKSPIRRSSQGGYGTFGPPETEWQVSP